jgi:hypothetical protein
LAVDDPDLINTWRQFLFLSNVAKLPDKYLGYGGVPKPGSATPQSDPPHATPPDTPPLGFGGHGPQALTMFFEDMNLGGDFIQLEPNRGYWDLTHVGKGAFGLGDWNDVISSVNLIQTQICVLHEDIHWTGQTLTLAGRTDFLEKFGWNDRASSLETW